MPNAMQEMFPTPVGMNRFTKLLAGLIGNVPHARGDEPISTELTAVAVGCSPRPWG